jgi:hypothetical protein
MLLPLWDLLGEVVSEPVSESRSLWNLKATSCAYAAGAVAFKEKPHLSPPKLAFQSHRFCTGGLSIIW